MLAPLNTASALACCLWLLTPLPAPAATPLTLDFSRTNGTLRPLHGVNLGPLCYRGTVDLSPYHRQLQPPLTRLHDVPWVNYDAVDISTIFRDFRNDPDRPDSYDFAATDDYLAALVNIGSPILYRLGESIEHTPRKYRVHPPRDFAKWADICCHIIRHYNEGWADGFHHNIQYWEIWNEPENQPAMWTGTDDQYLQLYEITARAIKSRWPNLKVGGPSFGYTGTFAGDQFKPGPFLLRFLQHCRDRQLPLDFFSWHRYAAHPSDIPRRAHAIRQLLDQHGFTRTESHCNEWNYLPNEDWRPTMREGQGLARERWATDLRGPQGAAFAAWTLLSLQDAPLDMANFYTAEVQVWGLFNFHGVPQKTFHAVRAFRELLDTPHRIQTPPATTNSVAISAGLNLTSTRAAVLLSNFDTPAGLPDLILRNLPWTNRTAVDVRLVDNTHDLTAARQHTLAPDGALPLSDLKDPAVALITLQPIP